MVSTHTVITEEVPTHNSIWLYVHPMLGNGLVNKFLRRQNLGKQSVARLRNNRRMPVNILTAMNTGRRSPVSLQQPVNTPLKNVTQYRGNCVFYVIHTKQTHGTKGCLLPGNEAVNMHL
jgi:hypothetical protein